MDKTSIRDRVRLRCGVYLVLAAALTGGIYGRLAGFGEGKQTSLEPKMVVEFRR